MPAQEGDQLLPVLVDADGGADVAAWKISAKAWREQFAARNSAGANAFADDLLGAVLTRGVDGAIAGGNRRGDELDRSLRQLNRALADDRHHPAVYRDRRRSQFFHRETSFRNSRTLRR